MTESSTIKERIAKLRKERLRSFIKSLIFIAIISTLCGVGFISMGMKNVFFFIFISFLPSIASILWDRKPGRFASKTVAAFNITGISPFVAAISASGSADSIAYNTMADPKTWVLVYGFAFFGWSVILLVPKITLVFLEIKSNYMINKMESFQQELLEEWGEDIRK